MTEFRLVAQPALDDFDLRANGITWQEVHDHALYSVAPYRDRQDAVNSVLSAWFKIELPAEGRANFTAGDDGACLLSSALGQWFLRKPEERDPDPAALMAALGPLAAVTDQSDAWVQIEITSIDTAPNFERLTALDLHPDHFPVGASARTVIEHVNVILTRLPPNGPDRYRYLLLSPRSFAGSVLHAIVPARNQP